MNDLRRALLPPMPEPSPSRQVLLMSGSEALSVPALHIIKSAGHHVAHAKTAAEVRTWIRLHRTDLAVVDLGDHSQESQELMGQLLEGAKAGGPRLLALTRATSDSVLRSLFVHHRLANFLAVDESSTVDPLELTVTVSKILTRDIFGIERYLAPKTVCQEVRVTDSRQKEDVVSQVESFARSQGCHPLIAEGIAVAADELFTNAVYNAPVDSNGNVRFAQRSRKDPVSLDPGEEVILRFGCDGRRFCLSARDPFGSLRPERVLDYLAKCFAKGKGQVDEKEGGAGLGLYTLFNMVQHFLINIAPGRCTEAIGLVDVSRSYRRRSARPKSFNVFLED